MIIPNLEKYAGEYHGKRWYSEILLLKENVENLLEQLRKRTCITMLKYVFYNAMIYYDETGIPIWRKQELTIYLVRLILSGRMGYATQHNNSKIEI